VSSLPPGARRGAAARAAAHTAALTVASGVLLLAGGCTIQPWVKPYERDRLADPIMSWDRDAISSGYLDHIRESREGSRGATGSAGGGCGCN
jgi:hypothetical protein